MDGRYYSDLERCEIQLLGFMVVRSRLFPHELLRRQVRVRSTKTYVCSGHFCRCLVLVTAAYAARIQTIGIESPSVEQIALGDRAMDMAAFLMVLAGAALAREGGREHWANEVQRWVQLGGLWLMFYLVLPENIPLKLPLTDRQIDLVVGELLGILGFVSLAIGVSAVAGAGITIALVLSLMTYEAAGLSRMLELFPDAANARNPMHAVVVYSIAICRVMVTAIVCYVVIIHCRRVRDLERKEQVRGELSKEGLRPVSQGI